MWWPGEASPCFHPGVRAQLPQGWPRWSPLHKEMLINWFIPLNGQHRVSARHWEAPVGTGNSAGLLLERQRMCPVETPVWSVSCLSLPQNSSQALGLGQERAGDNAWSEFSRNWGMAREIPLQQRQNSRSWLIWLLQAGPCCGCLCELRSRL